MAPVQEISAFGPMRGELFRYAAGRVAFESVSPPPLVLGGDAAAAPKKCILIGGLSDGLMPVPYVNKLEVACTESQWSLVQPILSSSYTGFGHGSLDQDAAELDELLDFLVESRGAETIALVGHSTGTQDIVHYLKHGGRKKSIIDRIRVVALQAPVSDRESASICHDDASITSQADHDEQLQRHMQTATSMIQEGQTDEMMPRAAFWAPISARRYLDLFQRGGRDDYFSSDYSDVELQERLGHVGALSTTLKACLVASSGSDEYVPKHVNGEALMHRLCRAMNNSPDDGASGPAIPFYLPTGNHNLSSQGGADATKFVNKIKELLQDCNE